MKILIGNDGYSAHYYERLGLGRAFTACGHETIMWQIDKKSVNDAFDELEPDLFIFQSYNFKPSIIRAIQQRPNMKVICKAGDWGPLIDTIDVKKHQILCASDIEIETTLKLKEEYNKPDYLTIYYHPDYIEGTHGYWIKNGIPVYSQLCAADLFDYTNGRPTLEFKSDITFIGGYWPYKALVFDKYLLPICDKYRVKIFGNSQWPVPQYCGFIDTQYVKHALASATICPNLNEPQSQEFGFNISERPFKLASNRCFIISDYVEGLKKLYPDEIVYAKTSEEFYSLIEYYLKHPEDRLSYIDKSFKMTILQHTYFDRVKEIFERLGCTEEANNVGFTKHQTLQKLGILV